MMKVLSSPCIQMGKRRHIGSGQMHKRLPPGLGSQEEGRFGGFLTSVLLGKRAVTNYHSLITPQAISIIVSRKKKCDELSRERKQPQEKRSQRSMWPPSGALECLHPAYPLPYPTERETEARQAGCQTSHTQRARVQHRRPCSPGRPWYPQNPSGLSLRRTLPRQRTLP